MNGFTRKKVKSLTLGERIENLRNERRISLAEISRNTKIQLRYLEALEEGNYSELPAPVYVKGFLRSYAEFFGVKPNYLLKAYDREIGIQNNIKKKKTDKEENKKPIKISSFIITPKLLTILIIFTLVFGGVFYLYKELDSFISTPRLIIVNPSDQKNVENSQVNVKGVTDKDGKVFINEQPTLVNDEGEFQENISLQNGVNIITVRAVNRFNKETVKSVTINANFENKNNIDFSSLETGDESEGEEKEELETEVSVIDKPVWISIEADGNLIYSGTLLPQVPQIFNAEKEIKITSGRGNNTYIKVNGKDLGILSDDPGVVRDVTFTSEPE